jgi:hypothetical protein
MSPNDRRSREAGRASVRVSPASSGARVLCELRNHGAYGFGVQFLQRFPSGVVELNYARGSFLSREQAIAWAEQERQTMESR